MSKSSVNQPDSEIAGARSRAIATRVVAAVRQQGRSLDDALATNLQPLSGPDQALVRAMAYGVLREYRYLHALFKPLLKRKPQPLLEALLAVGYYQLRQMRIPSHAAVHATVAAASLLGLAKAKGLVNALMRRHERDQQALEAQVEATLAIRYSHPDWLVKKLSQDWPGQLEQILQANNTPAPMHLRVNRRHMSRQAYRDQLNVMGIASDACEYAGDTLTLQQPVTTADLPGFSKGHVSVQDISAQQAVELLDLADGQKVLDACAAPGNKTAHILEHVTADLTAIEIDANRMQTLEKNLQRLGLKAQLIQAEAGDIGTWWDGVLFDRILLDAPCSGTGVIRRHPDIKWLRRAHDIDRAARRQYQLLKNLWPLLKENGRLVYATCSILQAEGSDVVGQFIQDQVNAQVLDIQPNWGDHAQIGSRLMPGEQGGDGFYYAVLTKVGL